MSLKRLNYQRLKIEKGVTKSDFRKTEVREMR